MQTVEELMSVSIVVQSETWPCTPMFLVAYYASEGI